MGGRVLVTARNVAAMRDRYDEDLRAAGVELVMASKAGTTLSEAELLEALPGCLAAIAMPDAYTARVLEASAPTLKLIVRSGVGYDSVDLAAATRLGIWVATTPGSNHDAVADFALLQILALARDYVRTVNQTRSGAWERVTGMELRDKTLAVIGTGRIGREVSARARGFGMRVVAFDVAPDAAWAERANVTYAPLEEALAAADVITLHVPLLASTRHLINTESLARCKWGVLIVNTARGPLIDERALADALDSGQVAGAALDVFDKEPPVDRLIVEHPEVLPSSHSAGGTAEASLRAARMALEEVLRVARGEPPKHPVNDLNKS